MEAIEELLTIYAENLRELRAAAFAVVGTAEEAEDVVQTVMTRFLTEPERCRSVGKTLPFLRACVRNEAVDYVRKQGRAVPTVAEAMNHRSSPAAEAELKEIENLLWVRSYVEKLSPEVREAFIRYVIDGCSMTALAKELGMSIPMLQKQFALIKKKIRRDRNILFTLLFYRL